MTLNLFIRKVLFVIAIIFIYRLGTYITIPSVNPLLLDYFVNNFNSGLLEIMNSFSGGAIKNISIFTIGIMPYITASIVIQMLSLFNGKLKELKESGEKGQIKLNQYTRYITFTIAFFQAITICSYLVKSNVEGIPIITTDPVSFMIIGTISLITGTIFLLWLAEKITEYGIGSGVSMLIFASILSTLPNTYANFKELYQMGNISTLGMLLILGIILSLFVLSVIFETANRRIKLSGSDSYIQDNHYLPLKVNLAGIMPPIFAMTIFMFPLSFNSAISNMVGFDIFLFFQNYLGHSAIIGVIIFSSLILLFSYIYSKVVFDPKKVAEQLKNSGNYLRGIRPGKPTEDYLNKIRKRITFIGSIYMIIICLIPQIMVDYFSIPFYLGGTSILIIVIIALEWNNKYKMIEENKKVHKYRNKLMNKF